MILGAPPDKDLLTIGEIGRLTGVPPHTLRYWEKSIGLVRPARRGSGHRRYTKKDLELLAKVRGLVEERGFTLAGVKRHLRQEAKRGAVQMPLGFGETTAAVEVLKDLKAELTALVKDLKAVHYEK